MAFRHPQGRGTSNIQWLALSGTKRSTNPFNPSPQQEEDPAASQAQRKRLIVLRRSTRLTITFFNFA